LPLAIPPLHTWPLETTGLPGGRLEIVAPSIARLSLVAIGVWLLWILLGHQFSRKRSLLGRMLRL
jgi:hypothetical protein